jgi:hypothetical protein
LSHLAKYMRYHSVKPFTSLPEMSHTPQHPIQTPQTQNWNFSVPKKTIQDDNDVKKFLNSEGFTRIMDFLFLVNDSLINGQDSRINSTGGSRKIVPESSLLKMDTVQQVRVSKKRRLMKSTKNGNFNMKISLENVYLYLLLFKKSFICSIQSMKLQTLLNHFQPRPIIGLGTKHSKIGWQNYKKNSNLNRKICWWKLFSFDILNSHLQR